MIWQPRTLLITDNNLGEAAFGVAAPHCADLTWIAWDMASAKSTVLPRIASQRWDLAISFYSDLVLPGEALTAIGLPLNIHPALPAIRGVGHDVVPIVEAHTAIGATLHRMEARIDLGEIYATVRTPLPHPATYAAVRAANQRNSLDLLDRLCRLLQSAGDIGELEALLRGEDRGGPKRWGAYYSRDAVAALRERFEPALNGS